MKLVPLGEHVVLQRVETEALTAGGILLPDSAKEPTRVARVLSVGRGRLDADGAMVVPQVREGDRVLLPSYGGTEVELGGETVMIIRESEILAVVG